jgi:hypothetical protein
VASFAYAGRGRMASVTLGGSPAKQSWSYNGVTGVDNAAGDFGVGLPTAGGGDRGAEERHNARLAVVLVGPGPEQARDVRQRAGPHGADAHQHLRLASRG